MPAGSSPLVASPSGPRGCPAGGPGSYRFSARADSPPPSLQADALRNILGTQADQQASRIHLVSHSGASAHHCCVLLYQVPAEIAREVRDRDAPTDQFAPLPAEADGRGGGGGGGAARQAGRRLLVAAGRQHAAAAGAAGGRRRPRGRRQVQPSCRAAGRDGALAVRAAPHKRQNSFFLEIDTQTVLQCP